MATGNLQKWNSASHLKSAKDIRLYFEACIEEAGEDADFMSKVYAIIECAKAELARSAQGNDFRKSR